MARVLVTTPMLEGCLAALSDHELVAGIPGGDAGAEGLLCAPTQPVDAAAIAAMPALRVIALAGAGADAVDQQAAAARGIEVLTAGEPLVETTADLVFGLIIAACRLMGEQERRLRSGGWQGWEFAGVDLGREVHGAKLGLVGYGRIARALARRAEGFGMHVSHHSRTPTGLHGYTADLDELIEASDILSIHVPLTEDTRGLIDRRRIGLLAPRSVLINTARGAIVDEAALAEALVEGRLFAAGLDVYSREPEVPEALLAAPRTVLLPHVGSATLQTRRAMLSLAAERLAAALAG